MKDGRPFQVRQLRPGIFEVSGSIPGRGRRDGVATDQVRVRKHSKAEADQECRALQEQRNAALAARRAASGRGMRQVATTLPGPVLASAEAAWTMIAERGETRSIFELVQLGMKVPQIEEKPLSKIVGLFISAKEEDKLAPRSLKSLKDRVTSFVREVGDAPTVENVKQWICAPGSVTTQRHRRADAHNFLSWAVRNKLLATNPIADIPAPRYDADGDEDSTPRVLSPEEAARLLDAAFELHDGVLVAYTALGLFAGLRPSEIARLDFATLENAKEVPVRGKVRTSAGQRLKRLVPVERNLRAILNRIDLSKQVTADASTRVKWDSIRSRAGLYDDWNSDCLRHSYCSFRLARGDERREVSEAAGNSEKVMRKHYEHPRPKAEAIRFWKVGLKPLKPRAHA